MRPEVRRDGGPPGEPSAGAGERVCAGMSTARGLAVLFVAGLAVRLWLARGRGFPFDVGAFRQWMELAVQGGLGGLYQDPGVNYPPVYMGVLYILGKVYRVFSAEEASDFLLKLPGVLADICLAAAVAVLADRVAPSEARAFPWRGPAAAAVLINPAVIFVSAVWGQVDSLFMLFVLLGAVRLFTGPPGTIRELEGLGIFVLALLTKPLAALVVPVIVLLLLRRHLSRGLAGIAHVALLGLSSLGYLLVMAIPTGIGPLEFLRFLSRAAGHQPTSSAWAFNLWGAVGFHLPDSGANSLRVAGVPALYVGLAAFSAGLVLLLRRAWRALERGDPEVRVALVGAAATMCLAFAVLTRMHERYLFAALPLLAPLVYSRPVRGALAALSALFLVNVYFPWQEVVSPGSPWAAVLYGNVQDSPQKKAFSVLTAAACLVVARRCGRWAEDHKQR